MNILKNFFCEKFVSSIIILKYVALVGVWK